MIRPTSLLRSDSNDRPQLTAPASNIKEGTIDCGITLIPCCLPSYCHKFATPKVFIGSFVSLAMCQGSVQGYFAATARHVGEIFQFSPAVIDWLLVSNDLFLGLFGLWIAYWGCRLQRASWIGGLACLQGVSCFLVIIPYLEHKNSDNVTSILKPIGPNLCANETSMHSSNLEIITEETDYCWIMLIVLFTLQLFVGLTTASFFAHGFSYIDDNVKSKNSPVYLAIAIAARLCSYQSGSLMAWIFLKNETSWWIGFPILGAQLLVAGTIVAMFPTNLLSTVLKQTAASILDIARGTSMQSMEGAGRMGPNPGFCASFKRVITNKIILFNTLSSIFLYLAMDNFTAFEGKYMEAQYYIPTIGEGFGDPWTSRLLRNILKPPIIALSVLISGLVIAKFKPRTRYLALWNVLVAVIVASVCLSYVWFDCKKSEISGDYKGQLISPFCSHECNCAASSTKFEPVCTQNGSKTYFSPCHAGCKDIIYINDIKVFSDCSCGSYTSRMKPRPTLATEGACDNASCAMLWKIFQGFTVLTAGLIASGFVGNVLITLRAVLPLDKGMAIAFELCSAGILVHVPGKFLYKYLADQTCQYPSKDGYNCSLHDSNFGDIISIVTAGIFLLSALMDSIVTYLARDLVLFQSEENDSLNGGINMENRPVQLNRRLTNSEDANSEFIRPARPRIAIRPNNPEEVPLNREQNSQSLPRYSDLDNDVPGYQKNFSPRAVTADISPTSSGFRSITPEMNRVGLPMRESDELDQNSLPRGALDSGFQGRILDRIDEDGFGRMRRVPDVVDGARSGSEEPRSSSSQGSDIVERVRPKRPPRPVRSFGPSGRPMSKEELQKDVVKEFKQYKSTMI